MLFDGRARWFQPRPRKLRRMFPGPDSLERDNQRHVTQRRVYRMLRIPQEATTVPLIRVDELRGVSQGREFEIASSAFGLLAMTSLGLAATLLSCTLRLGAIGIRWRSGPFLVAWASRP